MKKINNKGFTLIEVLAVLVILVAITRIAIPTITSSMERTKERQNDAKKEMLAAYAEEYVQDNKNEIYKILVNGVNSCAISIEELKEKGYIKNDAELDVDGNEINGYIIFDKSNNSYNYENITNQIECRKIEKQTININNTSGYFIFVEKEKICFDGYTFCFQDISGGNNDIFYVDKDNKNNLSGRLGALKGRYFCMLGNNINNITTSDMRTSLKCENGNLYRLVSLKFNDPLLTIETQLTNYAEDSFRKCS